MGLMIAICNTVSLINKKAIINQPTKREYFVTLHEDELPNCSRFDMYTVFAFDSPSLNLKSLIFSLEDPHCHQIAIFLRSVYTRMVGAVNTKSPYRRVSYEPI